MLSTHDSSAFYTGMTQDGRMILTREFAESLRRAGFPPGPAIQIERGYATDSAAALDADEPDDVTAALNRAYERMLRGGNAASGPDIDQNFAGVRLTDDFERRAAETRTRAAEVHADLANDAAKESRHFAEYKRSRGWDGSSDQALRQDFALEQWYARQLREAN